MSYRVILADCPWAFADRREFRRDNPEKKTRYGVGAKGHYERLYGKGTMPTQDLCALGEHVKALAAPDGYLMLWALNSMLPEALEVLKAWGYTFRTSLMYWTKVNPGNQQDIKKNGPGLPGEGSTFYGPGRYTFTCSEQLLLGTMGRPWNDNKGCFNRPVQEVMTAHEDDFDEETALHAWCDLPAAVHRVTQPRGSYWFYDTEKEVFVQKTGIIPSRKPAIFQQLLYDWLVPYCGDGQFLELFATERKPGWDAAGCVVSGGMDIAEELRQRACLRSMPEYGLVW